MKVHEAMHAGVEWCSPDTRLPEIARLMREYDIGAIPVGENDRLVGMVTDRDLACRGLADGRDPASMTAREVMTDGIVWCHEHEELDDAIRLMEARRIRRLPVIDANRRMVGMLSLGDVSHAAPPGQSGGLARAVSAHH